MPLNWRSKLIHPSPVPQSVAPEMFNSLVTPTYRGSTVVFENYASIVSGWRQTERGYSYGLYGTPTVMELAARIADLEGAHHTFIVPGGQAAIALVYLSFCKAGSHVLLPDSAYSPNTELAEGLLRRMNIDVEAYDPLIGAGIAGLIRDNTALIWTESPGSVTMEVQDVPAIVAAARARGVIVALDNTWSAGVFFDAFAHGVDVSIQALTKYVGGHSDILMGSVSVSNRQGYEAVGPTWDQMGMGVSPDDASLALRGLQTMAVRLDRLQASTLEVARWLKAHPLVAEVLQPALPDCPGHAQWKRDFTGSTSVFSIVMRDNVTQGQIAAFVDALQLFKLGYSWAGLTALIMVYPHLKRRGRDYGGRLLRLNIGLEEPSDLIADLDRAFEGIAR